MHLRRALLLFALVLGLTALAASIAPPPRGEKEKPAPAPAPPAPSPSTDGGAEAKTLPFRAPPAKGGELPERKVAPEAHVVIEVRSREVGQATIPKLGRLANTTETVPARFNLLAPPPGRYDVLFEPSGGEPSRVGTLVTAE